MLLTRQQRVALKAVFDRGPDWFGKSYPASYRAFRKQVEAASWWRSGGGPACVMVPAAGMWLGIEPDGYTHS